jgi:hypothetical protein
MKVRAVRAAKVGAARYTHQHEQGAASKNRGSLGTPDAIRLALLERLPTSPGKFLPAGELSEFEFRDVINEIVHCDAEDLLEARVLPSGHGGIDAVALRLKARGAEWLRHHRLV